MGTHLFHFVTVHAFDTKQTET